MRVCVRTRAFMHVQERENLCVCVCVCVHVCVCGVCVYVCVGGGGVEVLRVGWCGWCVLAVDTNKSKCKRVHLLPSKVIAHYALDCVCNKTKYINVFSNRTHRIHQLSV